MKENNSYHNHVKHYQLDGEYYDFFSPDKFVLQEIRRRYQQIFRLFPAKSHHKILEIGSGGGFALENLRNTKPFFVPLDIPTVNLLKMKSSSPFSFHPCSADAYNLPFDNSSFDLVLLLEVIEHLADPRQALCEIHKILKSDGLLTISVPYNEKISYQICIHCNKPTPTHSHLHSFDENSLKDLLVSAGFETVKMIKICNKIPNRLHFNILARNLPFSVWKWIDGLFNRLVDKPISLIGVGQKMG